MSWSRSYHGSHGSEDEGIVTIRKEIKTHHKHPHYIHYPQSDVYTTTDGALAVAKSTTSVYRSASTGAFSDRNPIGVVYRSNTKTRSRSRSSSPERGRTLETNRTIVVNPTPERHHSREYSYVRSSGMLVVPETARNIYRSASTGTSHNQSNAKTIYRTKNRRSLSRSLSPRRERTLEINQIISKDYHKNVPHSHWSRSYTSRSVSRGRQANINITHVDVDRPTYIRVHRSYICPDTLDAYNLPWEWDSDTDYIIIKQWVSEDYRQVLFAHTRRIQERSVVISQSNPKTTVTTTKLTTSRGNIQDSLYVVRKKHKHHNPATVVYREHKSLSPSSIVYRKHTSPGPTTVVYRKEKSPNRPTIVYT